MPLRFCTVVAILLGIVAFLHLTFSKSANSIMKLTSPAFENHSHIPSKYTCDGLNINPPLLISGTPEEAKTLVLVVDDPDAPRGDWTHWLVWNIDPKLAEIAEDVVFRNAIEGLNDFGKNNYGGPCPPSGTHRYQFKLYALDTVLDLSPRVTKGDLVTAMRGHILEQSLLVGVYERR